MLFESSVRIRHGPSPILCVVHDEELGMSEVVPVCWTVGRQNKVYSGVMDDAARVLFKHVFVCQFNRESGGTRSWLATEPFGHNIPVHGQLPVSSWSPRDQAHASKQFSKLCLEQRARAGALPPASYIRQNRTSRARPRARG